MDRPRPGPIPLRYLLEEDVLEVVVKVGTVKPREILAERGLMGLYLAQGLERAEVVLAAGLEAHVPETGGIGEDGGENVAEHGRIDLPVLGLDDAVHPQDVEDVGDVGEARELREDIVGVGHIALDVFDGEAQGKGTERDGAGAVDLLRPPGVSERGRISARLLPTMPVTPITRPTLWKLEAAPPPPESSSIFFSAAPMSPAHRQLMTPFIMGLFKYTRVVGELRFIG